MEGICPGCNGVWTQHGATCAPKKGNSMKSKGWIGVDLDGTLALDMPGEAFDPVKIGAPIPAMVARVQRWLGEGREVRIFTARASTVDHHTVFHGTPEEYRKHVVDAIQAWCLQHIGVALKVTAEKDYQMQLLYDDRARQVIRNEGVVVKRVPWESQ